MGTIRILGPLANLRGALAEGYVYAGHYSAFRQRRHGHSSRDIPPYQFVVCAQNHDQVGNRMLGERLSQLVTFEALKVAASVVLLSPCIPAVHGRGIWRDRSVSLLHQPPRCVPR